MEKTVEQNLTLTGISKESFYRDFGVPARELTNSSNPGSVIGNQNNSINNPNELMKTNFNNFSSNNNNLISSPTISNAPNNNYSINSHKNNQLNSFSCLPQKNNKKNNTMKITNFGKFTF